MTNNLDYYHCDTYCHSANLSVKVKDFISHPIYFQLESPAFGNWVILPLFSSSLSNSINMLYTINYNI